MEGFMISLGGIFWESPNDDLVYILYEYNLHSATRDVWTVRYDKADGQASNKHGTIYASENLPNLTKIQFIDGVIFEPDNLQPNIELNLIGKDIMINEREPIGESFFLLADSIIEKWKTKTILVEDTKKELWENIPNVGWYRNALKLWHEGLSIGQIGRKVGKSEQTVRNKIAELRNLYGEDIVPYRRK